MWKLLLIVSLFFLPSTLLAKTVENLYEVAVPVFSQSRQERKSANVAAFSELLIRITGRQNVIKEEKGKALLKKTNSYIRSFRYESIEPRPSVLDETADADALQEGENGAEVDIKKVVKEPEATQALVVSFDEKAVKNKLWKLQLPVWGATRPNTLVWLVVQHDEQRSLINESENSNFTYQLTKHAKKRGLPVMFPKLDLIDQAQINVTDVWGDFDDPILAASERYSTEAILSTRIFKTTEGGWRSRWSVRQGVDVTNWRVENTDLDGLIAEGMSVLAENLAERYAHVSTGGNTDAMLIYISDVKNISDYQRLERYLNSLSTIKKAMLSQIRGEELVYELLLRSDQKALTQAISLGKTLLSNADPLAMELTDNRLSYRLVP